MELNWHGMFEVFKVIAPLVSVIGVLLIWRDQRAFQSEQATINEKVQHDLQEKEYELKFLEQLTEYRFKQFKELISILDGMVVYGSIQTHKELQSITNTMLERVEILAGLEFSVTDAWSFVAFKLQQIWLAADKADRPNNYVQEKQFEIMFDLKNLRLILHESLLNLYDSNKIREENKRALALMDEERKKRGYAPLSLMALHLKNKKLQESKSQDNFQSE